MTITTIKIIAIAKIITHKNSQKIIFFRRDALVGGEVEEEEEVMGIAS